MIEAEDEAAALQQSAARLQDSPSNIKLEAVGSRTYRAVLRNADAEVSIEISRDGLEASIVSYVPPLGDGEGFSPPSLDRALEHAGIGRAAPEAVGRLLSRLRKGLDVRGFVVARGTPPQDGADGRFELANGGVPLSAPRQRDANPGARKLGSVPSVEARGLIGRIVPPQTGRPGQDVRGNALPCRDGKPFQVRAGRNVEASADGSELRSRANGVIVLANGVLSVQEVFEIRRDVGFLIGDVCVEHASVSVRGSVRSGMTVTCGGHLTVGEAIENAHVEAGGDVRVGRGVAMRKGGRIKAGGSVFALFAENAIIEAGDNVAIANDMTNCDVYARGQVVAAKGKRRIQGGSVRCGRGVRANEIGSPLAVATEITVGLPSEKYAALLSEKHLLNEFLQKAKASLGVGDPVSILERLPIAKRQAAADLLKAAGEARRRLDAIEPMLAAEDELLRRTCQAGVEVRRTVYPGVFLTIAGRTFEVREPMGPGWFHYEPESNAVAFEAAHGGVPSRTAEP